MAWRKVLIIVILALPVGWLLYAGLQGEQQLKTDNSETSSAATTVSSPLLKRPIVKSANGYVGADACQDCHQEQFKSWHASYHRTMTQLISEQTAPQVIWDTAVDVGREHYEFERENGQFFVTLNDPTAAGQSRRRQLLMMTGSHHMHVFWYESDVRQTPGQLPIVYLKDQERWVPRHSVFLQPSHEPVADELGRWNNTCSRCHSTHPRQRLVRETNIWDTHVSDFGIACEACHGPGEQHVAIRELAAQGTPPEKDAIVQPENLSSAAKSDVCAQCHSVYLYNFDAISVSEYHAQGAPFRPGMELKKHPFYRVIRAGPEHWDTENFKLFSTSTERLVGSFWADGQSRATGSEYTSMVDSACFQHGSMSCMSCHTMHEANDERQQEWRDDQLKPNMRGNQACLQCHNDEAQWGPAHTHHQVGSSGSQCMNCHMPMTSYGLLKTVRSHRISSPSVDSTINTGRPNACNLCHLDQTLQWSADHLSKWYGQPEPELTRDEKETSLAVLQFLKGDAAQRAIQASAFGWPPAREVSGTQWMPPFLMSGMNDPYDAVRLISERSLRSIEPWQQVEYDFLDRSVDQTERIMSLIKQIKIPVKAGKAPVLFDDQGKVVMPRLNDLIKRRNERDVEVFE